MNSSQEEIWKEINDYENIYQISNYGNVRNIKTNRILKSNIRGMYLAIGLWNKSEGKNVRIHNLVASAFVPNPENKTEINHIDGNKLNNHFSNLEWCTHKENIQHAHKNKLVKSACGEKIYNSKLTKEDVLKIKKLYNSGEYYQHEIATMFNVTSANIQSITSNSSWKHLIDKDSILNAKLEI